MIEFPVCDNSRLPIKENQICLVVGYTSKKDANKSSYISFCHPRTSRILHTITTKEKVIYFLYCDEIIIGLLAVF